MEDDVLTCKEFRGIKSGEVAGPDCVDSASGRSFGDFGSEGADGHVLTVDNVVVDLDELVDVCLYCLDVLLHELTKFDDGEGELALAEASAAGGFLGGVDVKERAATLLAEGRGWDRSE